MRKFVHMTLQKFGTSDEILKELCSILNGKSSEDADGKTGEQDARTACMCAVQKEQESSSARPIGKMGACVCHQWGKEGYQEGRDKGLGNGARKGKKKVEAGKIEWTVEMLLKEYEAYSPQGQRGRAGDEKDIKTETYRSLFCRRCFRCVPVL